MEEIISRIIDIDKKAAAVVAEAEYEKANLDSIIKSEIEQMKKEINKRAEEKCEYIKNLEDIDAQKHLEQINEKTNAVKQKLKDVYNQKHDEWVESIVKEIIG